MTSDFEAIEPLLSPYTDLADPIRFRSSDLGFENVRVHSRNHGTKVMSAYDVDTVALDPFVSPLDNPYDTPRPIVMGIVNVTPDSFSDGGQYDSPKTAVNHGRMLVSQGATILDFGAESTRPGAETVPADAELARLEPLFAHFGQFGAIVSVDTRKSTVAAAAIQAGAHMINDVSGLEYDPEMSSVLANSQASICIMHTQGIPETMQDDPQYHHVVLDIYQALEQRIQSAVTAGIDRSRIIVDPGIGFGKSHQHNLAILRHLSIFHGLGCPILLGASRKSLIEKIDGSPAEQRVAGSIAIALDAARKGVQILRVHDVFETQQALKTNTAIEGGSNDT